MYASLFFTMNYGVTLPNSTKLDYDYICEHGPSVKGLYIYAVIACKIY